MHSIPMILTDNLNTHLFNPQVGESYFVYIPEHILDAERKTHYKKVGVHHRQRGDGTQGTSFTRHLCTRNIGGGKFSEVGYDYTCPLCSAMNVVWNTCREEVEAERDSILEKKGAISESEFDDLKKRIYTNMPLKAVQEHVFFPILVINKKDTFKPGWETRLELKFISWGVKRYEDSLLAHLKIHSNHDGTYLDTTSGIWTWKYPAESSKFESFKNATFFKSGQDEDIQLKGTLDRLAEKMLRENVELFEDDMTYTYCRIRPVASSVLYEMEKRKEQLMEKGALLTKTEPALNWEKENFNEFD